MVCRQVTGLCCICNKCWLTIIRLWYQGINAAVSVTCLVLFHHLKACLQSFKVVSLQGNTGHTALILSQQGMSPVAPKAMAVPCTTLHLLFTSRQD